MNINTPRDMIEERWNVHVVWSGNTPHGLRVVREGDHVYFTSTPMKDAIKQVFGKSSVLLTKKYAEKRLLKKGIYLRKVQSIFLPDGRVAPWYTSNWKEEMYQDNWELDLDTGELFFRMAYPKVIKTDSEIIVDIIKEITGDMYPTFMQFLAQLAFEERSSKAGRATLLLYGVRGGGKNFITDNIIKHMLPGLTVALPSNWRDFNGFVENKFIYVDEFEASDMDKRAVSVMSKKLSGTKSETINQKYREPYTVQLNCYFAVMSNEIPLFINEMPKDDTQNQFVCIKMRRPLPNSKVYQELAQKYSGDLTQVFKENIGHFIIDKLLPIYLKMKENAHKYRYGFSIPLNASLVEIHKASMEANEFETSDVLEVIYNKSDSIINTIVSGRPDAGNILEHWRYYKETSFLTNQILNILCNHYRIDAKKMKRRFKNDNLVSNEETKRVGGNMHRGVTVNTIRLQDLFNENIQETIYHEDILEDIL